MKVSRTVDKMIKSNQSGLKRFLVVEKYKEKDVDENQDNYIYLIKPTQSVQIND